MNDEMDVCFIEQLQQESLAEFFGEVILAFKSLNPATGYPKRTGGFSAGAKKWGLRMMRYANYPSHMIVFFWFRYDVLLAWFLGFSWILSSAEQT